MTPVNLFYGDACAQGTFLARCLRYIWNGVKTKTCLFLLQKGKIGLDICRTLIIINDMIKLYTAAEANEMTKNILTVPKSDRRRANLFYRIGRAIDSGKYSIVLHIRMNDPEGTSATLKEVEELGYKVESHPTKFPPLIKVNISWEHCS